MKKTKGNFETLSKDLCVKKIQDNFGEINKKEKSKIWIKSKDPIGNSNSFGQPI
ncbi:hypothetical protein MSUIS_01150 [Mycoplasma suis KI3806]|uniref:Uncharacterized protein n=1 Tax=Mycoplasma suis (strain KI_3806) TaxID=708248 RepID=F0V2Y6_MYCS3|nr:hypothetical protein [Mycoplasma suis]CBZ40208.1 hypothetical protein MSUIS_01150 [Mycoplasma suis KI3806]